MLALDFEYDGQYLSDFGFIICDFGNASGANNVSVGSQIDFKLVSTNHGKSNTLTSADFSGTIQATFDICKNPDKYDQKDMYISSDEYRDIARWLNRGEFCLFQALYEDDDYDREPCFYKSSFNLSKILIGEKLAGITLEMTTDKPFGYAERITKLIDTSSCERTFDLTGVQYTAANVPFNTSTTTSGGINYYVTSNISVSSDDVIIFNVTYETAATRAVSGSVVYSGSNDSSSQNSLNTIYSIIFNITASGTASFTYPNESGVVARITRLTSGTPTIIYGYGVPTTAGYIASANTGKIYINKNTGDAYVSNYYNWIDFADCTADSYTDNVYDPSDDVGYIYPDVVLTCGQAGTYTIQNILESTTTTITNCAVGEVITMRGQTKIIETTSASHDIATDFNFKFLKIGNNYDDNRNVIVVNAPCTISITFDPIIKDCI